MDKLINRVKRDLDKGEKDTKTLLKAVKKASQKLAVNHAKTKKAKKFAKTQY